MCFHRSFGILSACMTFTSDTLPVSCTVTMSVTTGSVCLTVIMVSINPLWYCLGINSYRSGTKQYVAMYYEQ